LYHQKSVQTLFASTFISNQKFYDRQTKKKREVEPTIMPLRAVL